MQNEKSQAPAPRASSAHTGQPLPTFLEHLHELRRRLFWVVGTVLVASSISYSFLSSIISVLTLPLGNQQLFYLTPGGGLSFSFKLCTYVGLIAAVPVIMYHVYRFLEPLMGHWRRSAIFYLGFSSALAASGVAFAYFFSLPAALHFLTGFNMDKIQAMLTADSYLSFVITYLLGAALLFQIPLLLMIINTMTPLKPSKLMKSLRFVVVGAFVIGAVISPTPDIMNQTFLALPIIGMFQFGVILVWLQNKLRRQPAPTIQAARGTIPDDVLQDLARPQPAPTPMRRAPVARTIATAARRPQVVTDMTFTPKRRTALRPTQPIVRQVRAPQPRQAVRLQVPARSVDGFSAYRPNAHAQKPLTS